MLSFIRKYSQITCCHKSFCSTGYFSSGVSHGWEETAPEVRLIFLFFHGRHKPALKHFLNTATFWLGWEILNSGGLPILIYIYEAQLFITTGILFIIRYRKYTITFTCLKQFPLVIKRKWKVLFSVILIHWFSTFHSACFWFQSFKKLLYWGILDIIHCIYLKCALWSFLTWAYKCEIISHWVL